MLTGRRAQLLGCISLLAMHLAAGPVQADTPKAASLAAGFENPPQSARPRVWWHWMNGNVTKEGIKLDMEWMKRVGIGGMQNFDANLGTPHVVPNPLIWMTPPWRDAFHYAAETAEKLGLELSIASSGGWSETAGPWVKPEEAMKKIAWSTTLVDGAQRGPIVLAKPPAVAGPFQAIAGKDSHPVPFYVDTQVVAYRLPQDAAADLEGSPQVTFSGGNIDVAALTNGLLAKAQDLPYGPAQTRAWIRFDYPAAHTVRSVNLGVPGRGGYGAGPPARAWLEASDDGVAFRHVADIPPQSTDQRSATFPAVTAKTFRIVLQSTPGLRRGQVVGAPGGMDQRFPPPATAYEISSVSLQGEARVHHFEEKAGFGAAPDYYSIATPNAPTSSVVAKADVIDLTGRMKPDGSLDWTPPAGRWKVIRLGYSLTGATNHPASAAATGLEADKLNATHIKDDLDTYLGLYKEAAGPGLLGKAGVRGFLTDSIESGNQNWTEDMLGEFQGRRGYDPRPWLPTLTGVIVDSAEASDRFLYDFRKTIAELVETQHYKQVADSAHARGLMVYGEALESYRPQLGDDMAMRRYTDIPMAAMWTYPAGSQPETPYLADDKGASSVAHVYGQNLTAAESLTASGWPWAFSPRDLKPAADLELSLGINRMVIHTSIHQPLINEKPGLAMTIGLGQYFNRNETWAEQAGAWMSYLARSSFLLQQGHYVADVAYFYGEEAPLVSLYGDTPVKDAPVGRGFDFVNSDVVLNRLSVKDGWLTTESGMRYRVLYLGGSSHMMSLPVLRRIEQLARAGAVIVGPKPVDTPTLADDRAAFRSLADALWAGADSAAGHEVGKGRILANRTVDRALEGLNLPADVKFSGAPDAEIMHQHRRTAGADIYFLDNRKDRVETVEASFRVSGRQAEFWRPETGERSPASYRIEGGHTIVPLKLNPNETVFVVFEKPAKAKSRTIQPKVEQTLTTLEGPWTVGLQAGRGAPASVTLPKLSAWNENADPGVRYYSGVGSYTRTIQAPAAWLKPGHRVELDLGDVRDLAEVWLNGKKLGVVWHAPYRINLSPALNAGSNQLEIKVVNVWVNRLIGDAQPGATKITFTTGQAYRADAPLRPSGLLGPVKLVDMY